MRFDDEDYHLGIFLIVLFLLAGVFTFFSYQEMKERHRLIEQCRNDGKKEYECKAMFKAPSSQYVPMPIIIPSGR